MAHADMQAVAHIRARALTGFADLVTDLGGGVDSLMRQHRLDPRHLDDGESMIDFRQMIHMLEFAAKQFDCPDFGLRLAQRQGLDVLGPLALVVRNSADVHDALIAVSRHLPYHSSSLRLEFGPAATPGCHYLGYDIVLSGCPKRRQTVELAIGVALKALLLLVQDKNLIEQVLFRHSPNMAAADYRRHCRCRVRFEQEINAVVFRSEALAMPVADSNPDIRRVAEAFVAGVVTAYASDLRGQVEALIQRQLSSPQCCIAEIADQLAMHPRTLQRRLAALGLRFDVLIDNLRKERVAEYLAQPGMRLVSVAHAVGYTQQTTLNRSCQRWFGKTPQQMRESP